MSTFSGHTVECVRGGRRVFSGLDFAIDSGNALLLVGPNGSGKSTLLRLMAGLLNASEGELRWDGRPVGDDPDDHRARIAYVGHQDAVKPVLTVAENLAFWAALYGFAADGVGTALERFGIAHLADLPGRFLSAGQKRRLNLSRVLVSPARLWLLDEPTTALDAEATLAFRGAVTAHCAAGGMAVIATHVDIGLPDADILGLDRFAARSEDPS